jgi:LDH2 family malate/lactate/ureidoglycolate dehydrogenase
MTEPARFPADAVRGQIEAILRAWGMAEAALAVTAEVMVDTDLKGIDSHGISMLPMYDMLRRKGHLDLAASPRVLRDYPAVALLDAKGSLGHPVAVQAMTLALEKCATHGLAAVSVVNSHHFGAAGYYAALAAAEGKIGIVTSSARTPAIVPTFGTEPFFGTNPLAFAAPAGRNPPVLLDIATAVVALNKVKVYALNAKDIPSGWVVDASGRTVTDSAEAMRVLFDSPEGGVNPIGGTRTMGGHKGYGLALAVQILSATLCGGTLAALRGSEERDNIGHFFLALDPAMFRPLGEFTADLDAKIDALHGVRRADPAQPVLVAGDPERAAYDERLRNGIPLPRTLLDQIRELAAGCGAPYLLA